MSVVVVEVMSVVVVEVMSVVVVEVMAVGEPPQPHDTRLMATQEDPRPLWPWTQQSHGHKSPADVPSSLVPCPSSAVYASLLKDQLQCTFS